MVLLSALVSAVTAVLVVANQPGLAISMYALIPVVLGVYWFGLSGGLLVAATATTVFVGKELILPAPELSTAGLWIAAFNRSAVFFGVAALVWLLLRRTRALAEKVQIQQTQLAELESLRAVLIPTEIPVRPHLQLATSFTPADGLVAGDFFLVVESPSESTTIVVGDVVGHGLEAARHAAFVRAALATFARFTSDPVQLLQLANAALVERGVDRTQFVTVACVNIGPPPAHEVAWACAGHEIPWRLDSGDSLPGGRVGPPLGVGSAALTVEAGHTSLEPGEGLLLFTDGLTEGRAAKRGAARTVELFGEERSRQEVRNHRKDAPDQVLQALVAAVTTYAGGPLADDLCLVAVRADATSPA
ncbi:MAG: PP2C family protein-serine/threonine phosphatase [Blastococcus sp.]